VATTPSIAEPGDGGGNQAWPGESRIARKELHKIMAEEHKIVYLDKPEWGIIGQAINDYNRQQAGEDNAQRLCFVLEGPDHVIVGGVIGIVYWDWLCVDLMWVRDDLRGRGYGHHLLTLVEQEARQRGAKHVHLDTFSFQAPGFYQQHGYQVFGELRDFPPGHQRYFLTKEL
jgi:GNAT superfamily N-acetyltransferase